MTKKLNKSAQVRKLLEKDFTADTIAKKVGCTKALVYQIDRKMRTESDKKIEADFAERIRREDEKIADALAQPLYTVISDPINPDHYKQHNGIETIDFIEACDLNYRLGNVIKYVSRSGRKGDALEDLKKARWYLDREISQYE